MPQHIVVIEKEQLDDQRGPIDPQRFTTGCDNSSVENDPAGLSRKSERSRVLSRESVVNKVAVPLPQYSNIPIQQIDFQKTDTNGANGNQVQVPAPSAPNHHRKQL